MKQRNINMKTRNVMPLDFGHGFTLIELLIGLLISLFIIAGAVTFLITSSRTLVRF